MNLRLARLDIRPAQRLPTAELQACRAALIVSEQRQRLQTSRMRRRVDVAIGLVMLLTAGLLILAGWGFVVIQ